MEVAEGIRNRDPFQASEAMRTLIEASAARYLPYLTRKVEMDH
jgi:DNA-binding FadR family transcriptional regulator